MSTVRFDEVRDVPPARDLGSIELWERSLVRSRQRRRLTELGRRARRRRQGASLAASAALVAGPVLPRATAAAAGSGPASPTSGDTQSRTRPPVTDSRVLLRVGSEGGLVAAAQRRLNEALPARHLVLDGIFGPLTRAAVEDFQLVHRLTSTGSIDTRTWALLFDAPVLVLAPADGAPSAPSGGQGAAKAISQAGLPTSTPAPNRGSRAPHGSNATRGSSGVAPGPAPASQLGTSAQPSPPAIGAPSASGGAQPVTLVAPSAPSTKSATYVLADGVALPLPRNYLVNGYVDQGVDYAAPGGTPLYAMGDGVIRGEGISGFGPNAPILEITSGPLKGLQVYYGHAGADNVHVGAHVRAGQQISQVGYGIVGISTGPHLEIGFYPPGPGGAGSRMQATIDHLLSQHPHGRTWGTTVPGAGMAASAGSTVSRRVVVRATSASARERRTSVAPKRLIGRATTTRTPRAARATTPALRAASATTRAPRAARGPHNGAPTGARTTVATTSASNVSQGPASKPGPRRLVRVSQPTGSERRGQRAEDGARASSTGSAGGGAARASRLPSGPDR